jgi:hypothetical protein
LFQRKPYHLKVTKKGDKNQHDGAPLGGDTKEPAELRTAASARKTAEASAPVKCRFRAEECVYNRDTKEHGLIREVYEKDGIIMYEVWLPATPNSLRWGHFVSDWTEGVLEPSDKLLVRSARLPNGS